MFRPEDHLWTNTQAKARTLGQLFTAWKPCQLNVETYPQGTNVEQVLDTLLKSVLTGDLSKGTVYAQAKFTP